MKLNSNSRDKYEKFFISRIEEIQKIVQTDIDKNRESWMAQIAGQHHTTESRDVVATKPFVSYPGKPTIEVNDKETVVTFHTPVLSFFNDRYDEEWHNSESLGKLKSNSSESYTASYAVWYSLKYDKTKDEFTIDSQNTRPLYNVGYDKPGHTYWGNYVGLHS